jgi:hypothetical protein
MAAKLKYNEAHDTLEIIAGDQTYVEDVQGFDESEEDGELIVLHHDRGAYAVVVEGSNFDGLESNTVYELVKVTTILSPDGVIELPADDDGEPA